MNKQKLSEEEIKSIEEIALINLKEEIKENLKDKTKEEVIDFVLEKLEVDCLGLLVQE